MLPILYQKGKGGATFTWKIWTEGADVVSEHGKLNGKMIEERYTAKPKNVGRANETTAKEQAVLEAKAKWENKLARKYSETIEETQEQLMLPMLAHKWEDRNGKVVFPMDVQPKFDGVRCLARWDGTRVVLLSRQGKEWTAVPHINKALERFFGEHPKTVLDGELYVHEVGLQAVTRLVKKNRPGPKGSIAVQYYVYDMPTVDGDSALPWWRRRDNLTLLTKLRPPIRMVLSYRINNPDELETYRLSFVEGAYEGAIVRALDGIYTFGHRSNDLLKVKHFMDGEFKILDVEPWEKAPECGKFVVEVNDVHKGVKCSVNWKAPYEDKVQLLKEKKQWIGKMLKVKFQRFTEDGSLFIPVGLAERLEED